MFRNTFYIIPDVFTQQLISLLCMCNVCWLFFFFKVSMELKKFPLSHNRFFGTFCNYLMCAVVFIQAYGWNYFNPSAWVRGLHCLRLVPAVYAASVSTQTLYRQIQKMFLNMWNCSFQIEHVKLLVWSLYMLHGSSINNLMLDFHQFHQIFT